MLVVLLISSTVTNPLDPSWCALAVFSVLFLATFLSSPQSDLKVTLFVFLLSHNFTANFPLVDLPAPPIELFLLGLMEPFAATVLLLEVEINFLFSRSPPLVVVVLAALFWEIVATRWFLFPLWPVASALFNEA